MRACFFATAVLVALPALAAAENRNLGEAQKRVAAGEFPQAIEELQVAEQLPGNSLRQRAEILALRASALLGQGPEQRQAAVEALVGLYHLDPEGTALSVATEPAKALAQQLKSERALVLHDRLVTARSGRPLRVRARIAGAVVGEAQLFFNYAPDNAEEFIRVQMDPAAAAGLYEVWLRPGIGGVPLDGEHTIRYFIEATGPGGAELDANGSAKDPIRLQLSENLPEAAGLAALDEGGKVAHPYVPPPPVPWYKRLEIVGPAAGAVVAVAVVSAILLQPKPQPANGTLGRVDLP
jgi:hypothetical protein